MIFRRFAIEHAQWIRHRPTLAVCAHISDDRLQRLAQCLVKLNAIGRSADRVQFEIPIADANPVQQGRQHLEHFRIARGRFATRRCRPDHFGANLVKLAVSSLLRTLPPKLGSDVLQLA